MTELEAEEYLKEHKDNFTVSNGEYCCVCQRCKRTFIGDKRQLFCKYCEQIGELEKENAELKAELEKWKSEWHEQVMKANDEGYARTLQGIEIEKLKKENAEQKEVLRNREKFIDWMQKEHPAIILQYLDRKE